MSDLALQTELLRALHEAVAGTARELSSDVAVADGSLAGLGVDLEHPTARGAYESFYGVSTARMEDVAAALRDTADSTARCASVFALVERLLSGASR